ncbi:MAG: YigZ family protein [Acidaminococcaceae bacterium]|jgi:uncharacterized YigZ family protein|nr:YigZ family protein [Acidaminococcaceae bacterium]
MKIFTAARDVQHEIVIEKSRFICTLKKCASEEEAQAFIRDCKKKYWDATHNCSAYVTGENGQAQRSSDDGEPAGTAGLPMLEVLRKNCLQDVAVVVTRYFGGIKLGAGGLVRAYTASVAETLQKAGLAEKVLVGSYSFTEELETSGRVLNLLYQQQLFNLKAVEYGEQVKITLQFEPENRLETEKWLSDALNRQIALAEEGFAYEERLPGDNIGQLQNGR